MGKQSETVASDARNTRTRYDELAYLGDMIRELTAMADRLECRTLANILDVARLEAEMQARSVQTVAIACGAPPPPVSTMQTAK